MSDQQTPQPPYPLHPSVAHLLDPEYVTFYNQNTQYLQQVQYLSVQAARVSGLPVGAGAAQECGSIKDYEISRTETGGAGLMVRVFTPKGTVPEGGWPVAIWFHGGGWVLGDINTENVVCSHMCSRSKCVVVTVDYRLAPENPYPAAVDDAWDAVCWISKRGPELLSIDASRIAVGGSSAGGNLAAIVAQRSVVAGGPKFLVQFLNVPVMDNTAMPHNNESYRAYEFTPALPAEKMLWYRRHYLPDEKDWAAPEASPLFWVGDWDRLPPALVVVGELDVLRSEGEQYADKLKAAGVDVDLRIMKGMPHPFLAQDAVLQAGRDAITCICETLSSVF
ncbi:hypothetical protein MBLNU459_g8483t1 [Dothideomycetes sp. NU459]